MTSIQKILRSRNKKLVSLLSILLAIIFALVFFFFNIQTTYYTVLPLNLTVRDYPYVDVVIDRTSYPIELDLGSRLDANIYSDILEQFNKSPHGFEKWKNFQGTNFEYQTYLLPKIEIGSLTFKNPIVVEYPREKEDEYVIWKNNQKMTHAETVGDLGRGILEKVNFLLDVEGSTLIFTNNYKKLKHSGYCLADFSKIPFELDPKGIVMEVDTDLGKLKLLLDTGCTWTMLHEFLYPKNVGKKMSHYGYPLFTSTHFTVNGTNFGNQNFYFICMTEELNDFDGFLGMDFIKKHVIYFDFSKKNLYISK